jgi:hypothetical protein
MPAIGRFGVLEAIARTRRQRGDAVAVAHPDVEQAVPLGVDRRSSMSAAAGVAARA